MQWLLTESITPNTALPACAISLPCSQSWGRRWVGSDGVSLLCVSPGCQVEKASPGTQLQARHGTALPGNGITSMPPTPSG